MKNITQKNPHSLQLMKNHFNFENCNIIQKIRIRKFDLNSGRFHLLTYLEDALARHLKPMLGRRDNL